RDSRGGGRFLRNCRGAKPFVAPARFRRGRACVWPAPRFLIALGWAPRLAPRALAESILQAKKIEPYEFQGRRVEPLAKNLPTLVLLGSVTPWPGIMITIMGIQDVDDITRTATVAADVAQVRNWISYASWLEFLRLPGKTVWLRPNEPARCARLVGH
ncbi:unnamed protein product, partial [Amoebophrya sp. A120]